MDDDNNCEDSRVRGLNAGGSSGKARGKGPQFTRVIPKFLQKYHQAPAIQAKFATLPKLSDEEEAELDDVQQAAICQVGGQLDEPKDDGAVADLPAFYQRRLKTRDMVVVRRLWGRHSLELL